MALSAAACLPAGYVIEARTVSHGDPLITSETALKAAEAGVVEAGVMLAGEGFRGIIIAGFGDPGLDALRTLVRVPVVGIGEAGMAEAAQAGRRFAIVTTTPDLVESIRSSAAWYGHADRLVAVHLTPGNPTQVMADPRGLAEALYRAGIEAIVRDGAQAILVGGGPLATAARTIASRLPVPVIEPVPAAVRLMLLRLASG